MKIVETKYYNGAREKVQRLGISMFADVQALLTRCEVRLLEETDTNSGAAVRELIDALFAKEGGWTKMQTGGIDWRKTKRINGTELAIGVEVQVSARSDLVVVDIMHLRDAIESGAIDIGVIVVPSDAMARFLTDRAPTFRETILAVEERTRSTHLPIVILAVEHDGPGSALPKRKRRT